MTDERNIYEYRWLSTESSGGGDIEEMVNEAIKDGWEYVETTSTSHWGSTQRFAATVVMRRAVVAVANRWKEPDT